MTDFTLTKDADGVAIITWDVPGKSMNVMSIDGLAELDALIDHSCQPKETETVRFSTPAQ